MQWVVTLAATSIGDTFIAKQFQLHFDFKESCVHRPLCWSLLTCLVGIDLLVAAQVDPAEPWVSRLVELRQTINQTFATLSLFLRTQEAPNSTKLIHSRSLNAATRGENHVLSKIQIVNLYGCYWFDREAVETINHTVVTLSLPRPTGNVSQ